MGNSRTLNRGTGNFLAKELRVWSVKRSEVEIQQWRNTQFNPKALADMSLLSYLRMTTGSFNEFNFASVGNSSITSQVSYSQISYVPDDGLVVCPIETFHSNHRCFLDPVEQLIAAVLPHYNSTSNELSWIFSANLTSLIEKTSLSQLSINWQTTDPVISSISQPMMNSQEMRIPASAFKEESDYPITLNVSNPSMTFVKVQNINFVPNSCHWFEVEDGDAFSFFKNYTSPPAIEDISFNLVLKEQSNGCSDFIFYDKLVEQIKYTFSPLPAKPAHLRFDFSDDKLVGVTLPKEEQSKFPSKENIQIVLSIFWTNQMHSSVLSTNDSTFQHVVYTLHFNERGDTVIPWINVNQSRILDGQTVVLNANETYLAPSSGYKHSDLSFKWVCPTSLADLCSGATNLTLTIPYEGFAAASGSFGQEYEFQIEVSLNKSDGEMERYYQSEYITWYDAAPTNFTLTAPMPVASTADNQEFKVTFSNYDDTELDQLNINWSIVPNLTNSNLGQASENGTVFTVSTDGFALQTSYQMFVTAVNRDHEFVTYSESISFSTSQPPSGGSAEITVDSNDDDEVENFTVSLMDWNSSNQPIKYRIWSTSDSDGQTRQSEMTFGWVKVNEEFSFIPSNDNPYQVEITDESREKVIITLQAPSKDQPEASSLIQQLSSNNGQISAKYSLMNKIVNTFQTNKGQEATGDQLQEEKSIILGKIEEDMEIINDDLSIEAGDSKVIVGETVKMLSIITQDPSRISDEIVQRSLKIMSNLTKPVAVFRQLLTNSPNFKNHYAQSLSNTLDYTDMKIQNINKGRNLESSTVSLSGINEINDQVKKAKDVFMNLLCASTKVGYPQQEIKTSSFNLILEKFSKSSSSDLKEVVFSGDQKTRIDLNATELIDQLSQSQQLDDQAVCLHVAFYKVSLKPFENDGENEKSQYSSPVLEYSLVDETGEIDLVESLDFKAFSQVFFAIQAETFRNNQTICMAYQLSEQVWAGQACKTTIDEKNMQVECYCNMMGNDLIGLFTDTSRLLGAKIEDPSVTNEDISEVLTPYHSAACVGVILIIVLFAIVTPITAFILDKKDFKSAQNKITIRAKEQLLQQVAQISQVPFALWRHKQEQVYSYVFQNRTLFSHYLTSLHPFFSIFSRYDILEMRLVRYALFFAQFSLFTFICVVTFGPQYRESAYERNEIGLDIRDANAIIILGFFGTIMLLPFPYLSKLFRSKYELNQNASKANKTDERMRQVSQSGREIFQGENTQEQNMINNNSPIQFFNCNSGQQQNPNEELFVKPQYRVVSIAIFGFAGISCVISFVLSIAFSTKTPVFNQYCMVASFYTGVFGSLFISNIVKIGIDSLLATRVADNNRSFLRFVVSSGAVDIVNEIRLVKQAEQLLNKMESANDFTPMVNLKKGYEGHPDVSNVQEALDKSNQNSEENVSVADVDLAVSYQNPFRTQNVSPNIRNQIELDQDGLRSDMNRKSYESALGRVKCQLDPSNKNRVRYSSVSNNGTQKQID